MRGLMVARMMAPVLLLATAVLPRGVSAACNTIPDAGVVFQADVGRIDRAFLRPGDPVGITIDSPGGSPVIEDFNHDGRVDARDIVVTIAFKPAVEGAPARTFRVVTAVPEHHACWLKEFFCASASKQSKPAGVGLTMTQTATATLVQFRYEQVDVAGPVVITVGAAGRRVPEDLATTGCEAAKYSGVLACIEHVQLAVDPPPDCATPTEVIGLPVANDFRDDCTRNVDTPDCKGLANDIRLTLTRSGNALINMDWPGILRATSAGGFLRRMLRGSSSIRAFDNAPGRIVIPNADYLVSLTSQGTHFNIEPLFVADDLGTRPNELTLSGRSDKGSSVLVMCRRRAVSAKCRGGLHAGGPCNPAAQEDCLSSVCDRLTTPAYFTCSGGTRDGSPCTRWGDCPSGRCQVGSTCHTVLGSSTGKSCNIDADCQTGQECGPGLFELRGRATNNIVTIPRAAGTGATGVCDAGDDDGQPCTSASTCKSSDARVMPACVGFRAEALDFQ